MASLTQIDVGGTWMLAHESPTLRAHVQNLSPTYSVYAALGTPSSPPSAAAPALLLMPYETRSLVALAVGQAWWVKIVPNRINETAKLIVATN